MIKKTMQLVAILAVVALVGMVSWNVVAAGAGDPAGAADARSSDGGTEKEGSFLRHLHEMAQRLHGGHGDGHHGGGHHAGHGDHHFAHMARLVEELELTPDQMARFETIHEILGSYGSDGHASMAELHDRLVAQVEDGYVDGGDVRAAIDEHVEQIRAMAYAVSDEMVALVNGLDAGQREILHRHLQHCKDGPCGHGG